MRQCLAGKRRWELSIQIDWRLCTRWTGCQANAVKANMKEKGTNLYHDMNTNQLWPASVIERHTSAKICTGKDTSKVHDCLDTDFNLVCSIEIGDRIISETRSLVFQSSKAVIYTSCILPEVISFVPR